MKLSVIIPASNEAKLLPGCLAALEQSSGALPDREVVVVSNGSRDGTAAVAEGERRRMAAAGWHLTVLDLPDGGKPAALDAGDYAAHGAIRAYLDADVTVSTPLMAALVAVLDRPDPAYASGVPRIVGRGMAARLYARTWARVPFMRRGVPGCGLFAMNRAGRSRWGRWPQVIADDAFARLNFAPAERHRVPHPYDWPIAEGWGHLVRVRRRQDRGVAELAERFPELTANDDTSAPGPAAMLGLALRDPLSFAAYAGVAVAVRAKPAPADWTRSR